MTSEYGTLETGKLCNAHQRAKEGAAYVPKKKSQRPPPCDEETCNDFSGFGPGGKKCYKHQSTRCRNWEKCHNKANGSSRCDACKAKYWAKMAKTESE